MSFAYVFISQSPLVGWPQNLDGIKWEGKLWNYLGGLDNNKHLQSAAAA